jgi:hypothetical protein
LLVCEKKSLTTAIRIIQEDNSQQNNNNCIEKQESPWVKVGDKQLKKKKKKSKHREAKKSPQHTAAESEENLSQISEETQTVQSNDVLNDQTRDKQKKDDPVGTKTYKSTTSTVSVVGESMIKHINGYKMSKENTKVQVSSFAGVLRRIWQIISSLLSEIRQISLSYT